MGRRPGARCGLLRWLCCFPRRPFMSPTICLLSRDLRFGYICARGAGFSRTGRFPILGCSRNIRIWLGMIRVGLFDLLLGVTYKLFGLRAIPMLLMLLKAAIAAGTFLLAYSRRGDFWKAVALSALAQYVLSGLQPLPYVFSILFFAIELRLLVSSRHSGSARGLWFLPLLFFVWANLHIQFGAGLVMLAVFLIASLIEHWLRSMDVNWLSRRIVPAASDSGERNQRGVLSGDVCDALRISSVTSHC